MKSFTSIALVASLALASPLVVREAEPVLEIDVVTELAIATAWATVFQTEGAPAAQKTEAAYTPPAPQTTTAANNGRGKGRTRTYNWHKETTTTYVAPVPTTTSVYVPPPPPTTTSTTEAPAPTTEQPATTWQAPQFTWPTQAPAAPTTTQAASAPSYGAPSSYTGDDSYSDSNLQAAIINSTNTYRTMFQAAPVTWNQSLVDMAVTSAAKCDFEHSNAGQNLAAGYGGPQGAVGGWGDEYKNFDFSHPDFTESTGHFTQLVWQDSTTVGCAAKKCPTDGSTGARGWYLICNYFPVGNMLGEFPENVKGKVSSSGW